MECAKNKVNQFNVLSDHGLTEIKTEVYLNHWPQINRYLNFENGNPETISDIDPRSIAFALDPSRLYINLKEEYPLGAVNTTDYVRIR